MSDSIHFLFCLHNHQPEGNFDHVFEEAYRTAYLPMLEVVERYPAIRLAQHFSGTLLEWLDSQHPEFLDRYRELVSAGRLEILTGGYFEPILPSIPDRDKLGQIAKLTQAIRDRFGYEPRGLWIAERVWEPYLPKPLAQAGVRYVPLDDAHFKINGLRDEQLVGYFSTEEQGSVISVFPVSERLRYLIPFQPPEATIDHLLSFADAGGRRMLMMGDDGEKFGVWPGTHDSVYRQGWLERFFGLLEQNVDRIRMILPAEYLERFPAVGNIYLPTASYREMMEWALAPGDSYDLEQAYHNEANAPLRRFLRGGFWRNFLVKYPEVNNFHKKMLWVGEKIDRIPKNRKAHREALNALWRGQCNCAYWHGVFGGLYLNFLRSAVYRSLIEAEAIADNALHTSESWVDVVEADFLRRGSHCVIMANPDVAYYFHADCGAVLFELDLREKRFNLLNTLTRRKEAYHRKLLEAASKPKPPPGQAVSIHDLVISKEQGLEKHLHYDWYRRSAAIDHFLDGDTGLAQFQTCSFRELGDFINQPYSVEIKKVREQTRALFYRDGHICRNGTPQNIRLEKAVAILPSGRRLPVAVSILNTSDRPITACYASEWGFAMNAGDTFDRYYVVPGHNLDDKNLGSSGTVSNTERVILVEEWLGVEVDLSWNVPATLWRFPIETIASSEAGFERCYQSSVVVPRWEVSLNPGESWSVQLNLEIRHR
jgi:alpha-amylase